MSYLKCDVIIIGAGVSGIYAAHKLSNDLGLDVVGIEKGSDAGGTWYWNRYPGVQADTDSHVYRYSGDPTVSPSWDRAARYQKGSQIRDYLQDFMKRQDLDKIFHFETTATTADFKEEQARWEVRTDRGQTFSARYLIGAAGVLSKPVLPNIPGLASFTGRTIHTARWPEGVSLAGARVAVFGTGSTGCQLIANAATEVEEMVVFQRTAQYVVPAGQRRWTDSESHHYEESFAELWDAWRLTRLACGFEEPQTGAQDVDEKTREEVFEKAWEEGGGFNFMFGTFSDLAFNRVSNNAAADFIKQKINVIVRDSDTVKDLTPTEPYARRPVAVDNYYETFNRENVSLVNTRRNPIRSVTPHGITLDDGRFFEVDVIVFATGFEAVDGAYRDFHVQGREGTNLLEHWGDAPSSYLGIATPKFPNFFTVLGPLGVFSNLPPGIEAQVDFIAEVIAVADSTEAATIEVHPDAVNRWAVESTEMAQGSVFAEVKSWIFGSNVHTDSPRALFYFGGLGSYRQRLRNEIDNRLPSFQLSTRSRLTQQREGAHHVHQ